MSQQGYCRWMQETAAENTDTCLPELRQIATYLMIVKAEHGTEHFDMETEPQSEYPEDWTSY